MNRRSPALWGRSGVGMRAHQPGPPPRPATTFPVSSGSGSRGILRSASVVAQRIVRRQSRQTPSPYGLNDAGGGGW
ncbi:hypothetical protein ACEZCY_14495 [Streptacidiphilus sp. N1-12]|uniref:Uncharacterized protein n=1 Tax=Streptacidiphilus alkalitolerans TaxID=3342712 RepID=A0ABV6WEH7_9ACTN